MLDDTTTASPTTTAGSLVHTSGTVQRTTPEAASTACTSDGALALTITASPATVGAEPVASSPTSICQACSPVARARAVTVPRESPT